MTGGNGNNPSGGQSPLFDILTQTASDLGCTWEQVTVLAKQHDPFRLHSPKDHAEGRWLADALSDLGISEQNPLHLRGIHYRLLDRPKPNRKKYANNKADWVWLQEEVAKAARWLGYVPFEAITDERNAEPVIIIRGDDDPEGYVTEGAYADLPTVSDLEPGVDVDGFVGCQAYRLAIFGEKSSLNPVLRPISDRFVTDLFLPTGELSDTMIYRLAKAAAEDGRPCIVFYISDCDPSGWQMAISLARKLQALKLLKFPDLDIVVYPIALTPAQVAEHGLPSSVLKETEKRAGAWKAAFETEQTEVDAVPPDVLTEIVTEAIAPFFDEALDGCVEDARDEWMSDAQEALEALYKPGELDRLRREARERLAAMAVEIEEIRDSFDIGTSGLVLPEIEIPEPEYPDLDGDGDPEYGLPLFDSSWSYAEGTERLRRAKAYMPLDDDEEPQS